MGIMPDVLEQQTYRIDDPVTLALENGETKIVRDGVEVHLVSVPTTNNIALGIPILSFTSDEIGDMPDCTVNDLSENHQTRNKLKRVLYGLGFSPTDKIIKLFFTTEFCFHRKT